MAKAKNKAKPVKSEDVVPKSVVEQVTDAAADALKEAGSARTAAITLDGLEYAENLGKAIKEHAEKVEKLYGDIQKLIKNKASDKKLSKLLPKIEKESGNTKKLQAWLVLSF